MKKYVIGITGASGSIYAKRLIEEIAAQGHKIYLIISKPGRRVWGDELEIELGEERREIAENIRHSLGYDKDDETITYLDNENIGAPTASGSFQTEGMVVVPCSMSTLSGIAHGLSSNLLERSADVILKEKRELILVPRETPLNAIHLENMLKLANLGVDILPPMPGFYNKPESIDDLINFVVGRILDRLGIEHNLYKRWS
ncbi:4-hydroxy-3-polyprenylbenzoate decarboxylase [Selenihalanaerobacter shriftii]|uniref:Flavin prenyltransferase UbiX n=1 Tax=Selenihalanaerobacter shriftii TaxID=142842 RepID=A0A1T4MM69_9FIRM|nr:4-hydroxy-3-polyprenylbenzoate decarboxylase [Selenihalanaerobacter shriftii]